MARTPKTQSEKATLAARRAWCYLVLVLISFLCLFFFYVLVINSTRTHFEIQKGFSLLPGKSLVTNFRNVLADANIPVGTGIRNSLIVSACSAALSVYFSALTAYGIYAYNFRFKKAAFAIILLIMTMPTQVSALGFLQLITKMGLKNSFVPLILPSIAAPTVFFFMKQYLDASLPMEIVEAARIDGAGEFYTFNKIVLPIMKPALAVQAIFSFVASWNNYFIPALVLDSADKKTLPILIAQLRSADFLKFDMGKVYMMVAIAILPVIVVYLLLKLVFNLRSRRTTLSVLFGIWVLILIFLGVYLVKNYERIEEAFDRGDVEWYFNKTSGWHGAGVPDGIPIRHDTVRVETVTLGDSTLRDTVRIEYYTE